MMAKQPNETRIIEFFNSEPAPSNAEQPPRVRTTTIGRSPLLQPSSASECSTSGSARTPLSIGDIAGAIKRLSESARLRARADRRNGVSLTDGLRSFRSDGACDLELKAYAETYAMEGNVETEIGAE